jgi:hypothetical protein
LAGLAARRAANLPEPRAVQDAVACRRLRARALELEGRRPELLLLAAVLHPADAPGLLALRELVEVRKASGIL